MDYDKAADEPCQQLVGENHVECRNSEGPYVVPDLFKQMMGISSGIDDPSLGFCASELK